jgi:hypothetical protein
MELLLLSRITLLAEGAEHPLASIQARDELSSRGGTFSDSAEQPVSQRWTLTVTK